MAHASLGSLTLPAANYLTGWSHGKEALKPGVYDTLKGSFYVNCAFYQDSTLQSTSDRRHENFSEYAEPNVWPAEDVLPGFRRIFEELCTLVVDISVLVARACDRYALANIEEYEKGYLERVVKTSTTTKARLLHYFPSETSSLVLSDEQEHMRSKERVEDDDWCATHIDHGCLTGLTSALYIDESAHPPFLIPSPGMSSLPPLPALPSVPSPSAGLYIKSRSSAITKVNIPASCLGFQTGEALELITGGKFRAVPHFVRAGGIGHTSRIARNTLAVFTQPNLGEVVDKKRGLTFADFSKEVNERFG